MHTLAGHSWGSQPSVLLIIYKTLVRSIFDFNAGIYDPGSKDRWNQLDRVQSAALRVALGARKSSPINALQVEAGVPPLSIRFRGLIMKKIAKWIGKTNNLIISTLEDLKSASDSLGSPSCSGHSGNGRFPVKTWRRHRWRKDINGHTTWRQSSPRWI